ncbi:MAG: hypothetical protein KJS68_04720 [Alphaproteobacteria bacterium]|nr:hypothetical protein [Alphaproteobacteria bacterium]
MQRAPNGFENLLQSKRSQNRRAAFEIMNCNGSGFRVVFCYLKARRGTCMVRPHIVSSSLYFRRAPAICSRRPSLPLRDDPGIFWDGENDGVAMMTSQTLPPYAAGGLPEQCKAR